ncbi:Uncharacterised protein [Legionella sainthelensi]|nr:Uncharacterised protein [Legionella sainthelensi]
MPDRTPLSLDNVQFSTRQFHFMMNNLFFYYSKLRILRINKVCFYESTLPVALDF